MNCRFAPGLALIAVLSAGAAPSPVQDPDLPTRVKRLEDEVQSLRSSLVAVEKSQGDATSSTIAFFAAQAKSGKALGDALKSAEENGFTAGINPRSREVLLAGMRSYIDGLEAALPSSAKKSAETKPAEGEKSKTPQ